MVLLGGWLDFMILEVFSNQFLLQLEGRLAIFQ